ncbi:MAG: hypothetical protein IKX25_10235 [Bacteroidales bacterium]|nr:hypothetical protein [Bacteroidales bacterium]
MVFETISFDHLQAWAQVATFAPLHGVCERHIILHVQRGFDRFEAQMEKIQGAYSQLLKKFPSSNVIMRRYLLSDIANQAPILRAQLQREGNEQGALSMIGQPPLDGTKLALWIYMAEGIEVSASENLTITFHNGYRHYWSTNWQSTTGGSNTQTREILEGYEAQLRHADLNLADNCLRTWLFIRDVDTNYKGMVEARCNNFTMQRLTPDTHYIASTGIGGQPITTQSRVQMDAYAAQGLQPEQQRYLYAPTHLNPTYQYGVTFERGTAIQYGDRRHLLISGTASINNKGEVIHLGDVRAQAARMLENIETLLLEGGASLDDVAQAIIYLRDVADYDLVNQYLAERLPKMPFVITLAPVCRPAWLIEMECIAIIPTTDARYNNF